MRLFCFSALRLFSFVFALTFAFSDLPARTRYDAVRMFGVDYVDARDVARRFGMTPRWVKTNESLRLQSQWTKIDFAKDAADIRINDLRIFLSEPVVSANGTLYLSRRDALQVIEPILSPAKTGVPRLKTIVIDAGHGGSDPGNQNPKLKLQEKRMTLDVALRLERLLRARGYRVVQTRQKDRFVEFDDRTQLIRKTGADLFISIHFNAFRDAAVGGTETYVMTPRYQRSSPQAEQSRSMMNTTYQGNRYDDWNILLGYHLHRELVNELELADRGLKRFRYRVLRNATCPAVLVEAAFLSNLQEGRKVSTAAYRQRIAQAIADGVSAYAQALKRASS